MLSGEFQRNLRKLNPKLRIFCGNNDSKPAGLFYIQNGEYIEICGVDKNFIPEQIHYDNQGHVLKSGYNRVLNLLVKKGFCTKKQVEKVFNFHLHEIEHPIIEKPQIEQAIDNATRNGKWHKDDLAQIGEKLDASY